MLVHCVEWIGVYKNLPSWWKNKEYVEITPEQIVELYETGINVMLAHGAVNFLFVDDKRFTQR